MRFSLTSFILRLKRGDTPCFAALRRAVKWALTASLPVPRVCKPLGRFLYELRLLLPFVWKRFKAVLIVKPLFASRCESVGCRLQLVAFPVVNGHTVLTIGDDVRFSGSLTVNSGRFCDRPTLDIGNRTFIGHDVTITCNRRVTIEDDVLIAEKCKISDYDGHSLSLENRLSGSLASDAEIQPVRICRGAWIGAGSLILKGVTIGEGAIVGASSVVTHDVPPYVVAAGSPARVVKRINESDSYGSLKADYAVGAKLAA